MVSYNFTVKPTWMSGGLRFAVQYEGQTIGIVDKEEQCRLVMLNYARYLQLPREINDMVTLDD